MTPSNDVSEDDLSGPIVDRRTTISLLAAAGFSGLAGCLGSDGGGSSGGDDKTETTETGTETTAPPSDIQTGGRLKAGWNIGSIEVLDPPYISVGQYFQVSANIFNGLVWLAPDLTIRGDLAKDWTVSNDGRTFTFDLHKGVTFHNGTKFTADDVRYTIVRTITKDTPAAGRLSLLKDPTKDGVVVKDDYTVELNFKKAMAPALIYLTRGPGRAATIVNKQAIQKMGQNQYSITPVGTGPFKVVEHEVGSHLTLDAFDEYFKTDKNGRQYPYIDGVDIQPIPEPATLINALRSGGIDFANLIPLQNVAQIQRANEAKIVREPGINWLGMAMNEKRKPFDSRKVRRGIAKLINNQEYIRRAYFGNALADVGPLNKGTMWVWREDKPNDQNFDPEEGKQLLKEAGATNLSFDILTTKADLRASKALRQLLNQQGLDVGIDQVTNTVYWDRFEKLDYDTTITGSVGDPDPDQSLWNFYRKPGQGGVWNWTYYVDDKVHKWLAAQRRTLDREKRKQILWKIEDRLIADAPHAYLAHRDDVAGKRPNVKGYTQIPFMRFFHNVWLDS